MNYLRITTLLLCLILISCVSGDDPGKRKKNYPTYWNDLALFLSGQSIEADNRFIKISEKPKYKLYAQSINKSWKNIETRHIQYVNELTAEFLPEKNKYNTALYPLSGADFLNLYLFCPEAPRYIMIGLEIPGFIYDPINLKTQDFENALFLLNASVNQIANQNYFTSILMKSKFSNKVFPGVAPVLMIFLSRLGFYIDDLQRITLNEKGEIEEWKEANDTIEAPLYSGIKFIFHKPGQDRFRELIFLKMYINENSHLSSSREGLFFKKQERLNLVMKSAIYLMHMEKFSDFVNTILSKTDMVAEDDSGIPIRFFPKESWDIKVFGKYLRKLSIRYIPSEAAMFKSETGNVRSESLKFSQEDLKEIYEMEARELKFKYGYGGASGLQYSNFILLRRKYLINSK